MSSLRTAFAAYRTDRAQRREVAALLADPDLSPAALQEVEIILLRRQDEVAAQVTVPASRQRKASRRITATTASAR